MLTKTQILAKFIPKNISAKWVGFALTAAVLLVYVLGNPLLDTVERKTFDMRLLAQGAREPAGDVVIAAIDEKSLANLGRWPWSRRTMARLVRKLDRLGARVLVFDVFFSETENRKLLRLVNRLESQHGFAPSNSPYQRIKQTLATDSTLGRAIKASGKVVLSMVFLMSEDETRHRTAADLKRAFSSIEAQAVRLIKDSGDGRLDFPMVKPSGLIVNLPEIQTQGLYTGHINSFPDPDGTLRWTPLVIKYGDLFFPSGDVQAVRAFKNADILALHTSDYGIIGLEIGDQFVATDEYGRSLIYYHGPEKTFPTYSVADIIRGEVAAEKIKNKIVLVGATAKGIGDIRVTPYGPSYPGVEIRANVIQNLITGDFIQRPGWMLLLDLGVVLGLGLGLTILLPRVGVRNSALLSTVLFLLYLGVAIVLFRNQHIWLNVTYPSVLILLLFMSTTILKYFTTETEKRQIKGAFQHYVPTTVVNEIIDNIDDLRLGGEKRELTVLFSDIRGFTTLSETMSPEDMVKLLNVYLTEMTEQVFKHDGLLDKYIGDAIMAVYGAPIIRQDHAILACHTALDMMHELHKLQAHWEKEGLPVMNIGIGLNTGPMIVGNMGSESRFDYTVIGDAVNLGSRIEYMNKTYGTNILLSEFTYEQAKEEFNHLREIDVARVRGRRESVGIYELMLPENYDHMDWLDDFARAYRLFHDNKAKQALPIFEELHTNTGDPVSKYYIRRCRRPRRRKND